MAHRGRNYELAFRRDWNINLNNNNDGLPVHYQIQWTRSLFTPPPLPLYFDLVADYAGELGTDRLQWLGMFPASPHGISVLKYTIRLSGVPATADKQLQLFDSSGSILLSCTIDPGTPNFTISDNIDSRADLVDPSFALTFPYPFVPAIYPILWGGNPT